MQTVLIIEDSFPMAQMIATELERTGYQAFQAHSGNEGLACFQSAQPDLVILDWMLPDLDGLEVLRRLRRQSPVPVMMLTARGDEVDRVVGLEVGADDYMVKPFGLRELLARVRALLRRAERLEEMIAADRGDPGQTPTPAVHCQGLALDPIAYQATLHGVVLDLSHTEFELLHLMIRNPGRTFTRRYLLETIWEAPFLGGDRSVDNAVLRLRRKLGAMDEWIETVRSVGYRWRK